MRGAEGVPKPLKIWKRVIPVVVRPTWRLLERLWGQAIKPSATHSGFSGTSDATALTSWQDRALEHPAAECVALRLEMNKWTG